MHYKNGTAPVVFLVKMFYLLFEQILNHMSAYCVVTRQHYSGTVPYLFCPEKVFWNTQLKLEIIYVKMLCFTKNF